MKIELFPVLFTLAGRSSLYDKTATQVLQDAVMLRIVGLQEVDIVYKGDDDIAETLPDGNDLLCAEFIGQGQARQGFLVWTNAPTGEDMRTLFEKMFLNHELEDSFFLAKCFPDTVFVQATAGIFTLDMTDMQLPVFTLNPSGIPSVTGLVNDIQTSRDAVLDSGPTVEPEGIKHDPGNPECACPECEAATLAVMDDEFLGKFPTAALT